MANIQTEVWAGDIAPNIYPDNSFLSRSISDDLWANNKTVNLPQSGTVPKAQRNRTVLPAPIAKRNDTNATYEMVELTTDPTFVQVTEEIEVSYDKRASVLFDHNEQLSLGAADYALFKWCPTVPTNIIPTSGGVRASLAPGTTGTRKALTRADIVKLKVVFDSSNIPMQGRYLLIDAQMHADLLADTTITSKDWVPANENSLINGSIGRLLGFDLIMRNFVGRMATGNAGAKDPDAVNATNDNAFGLAWHMNFVRRAKSGIQVFYNEKDATLYGDAFSAMVRIGAAPRYPNFRGVAALVEVP